MKKTKSTSNAVEILHNRYINDDPERQASLQAERINAEIARLICDLRRAAGLNQKDLAQLIGTTQSVVSRLEDADYQGHSLSMLNRIAQALDQRLTVQMTSGNAEAETARCAFREVVRALRKERGLTVDEFSTESGIERNEVLAMERDSYYRPPVSTLHKLSTFYDISQEKLATLTAPPANIPEQVREPAVRYMAQSESIARLSREEQKILKEFMKFLQDTS